MTHRNDTSQQNKKRRKHSERVSALPIHIIQVQQTIVADHRQHLGTYRARLLHQVAQAYSALLIALPKGNTSYHSSDIFTETEQVVVNGSLAETGKFYPPYLSKAIRRIRDQSNENAFVAAISMTFPDARVTTKIECQMALEITANKVEHMAKELFDAHLETTEGLRYVCLPLNQLHVPLQWYNASFSTRCKPVASYVCHRPQRPYRLSCACKGTRQCCGRLGGPCSLHCQQKV